MIKFFFIWTDTPPYLVSAVILGTGPGCCARAFPAVDSAAQPRLAPRASPEDQAPLGAQALGMAPVSAARGSVPWAWESSRPWINPLTVALAAALCPPPQGVTDY